MQIQQAQSKDVIIKILTMPSKFRKQLGFKAGDTAKAKIVGDKLVVQPKKTEKYKNLRVFTKEQIDEWVKEDQLPEPLASQTEKYWDERIK